MRFPLSLQRVNSLCVRGLSAKSSQFRTYRKIIFIFHENLSGNSTGVKSFSASNMQEFRLLTFSFSLISIGLEKGDSRLLMSPLPLPSRCYVHEVHFYCSEFGGKFRGDRISNFVSPRVASPPPLSDGDIPLFFGAYSYPEIQLPPPSSQSV